LVNLFLQLLHHPEVQEKVQEEIDRVCNRLKKSSQNCQKPMLRRCYVMVPNPNMPNPNMPTRQIVDSVKAPTLALATALT
jgi:cytochrome P450